MHLGLSLVSSQMDYYAMQFTFRFLCLVEKQLHQLACPQAKATMPLIC